MLICYFPLRDAAGCRGEIDAYLVDDAAIALEGLGILLRLYLLKGCIGTLVYLQLKNVDVIGGLDEDVHATVGRMTLHIDIETEKPEPGPKGVLQV